MAPIDPHSYTDSTHPLTTHISLSFYFDFASSTILSSAVLSLAAPYSGAFTLDSRSLSISEVLDPATLTPPLHSAARFPRRHFGSIPHCHPLQPLPVAIHARSIFPCQDTPAARIKYAAKLNIPRYLSAVMGAKHVCRRDPIPGECGGACDDSLWCGEGRVVEEFVMEQPIPPYLFAFAVGELGFREVGPRTKVYSEAVPGVLDAAATEFAGTEEMIKGDATGAQVVAHELAHSWTGNLITNKSNDHFWLNEGFTTYAERRIVEAVQGKERAVLNIGIGWKGLVEEMERFKDNMEFTKLKTNQQGVDPDDVYSQVPYEKGFQFLWRIERQIGRPAFDEFLKKYIATFKFQSIDTDTFLDFLKANVPGIENHIDLKVWTEGTGIPPDAMEPASDIYTKIVSLANEFKVGRMPNEDEVADWGGQEWELYLENLPKSVEASQVLALDARYKLSESKDYEVKVAFLQLAISSRCSNYYNEVEKTLKEVGRMKYLAHSILD
ncbi:Leucine aminopeptidase [Sesamum angolense]|uniref:soluble epoxide hydrolase n=1 Tax=Sesamum angolense TaxID=2727404 RepID=A0AAE1X1Z2_9LAMI|nr:Leucine aminopeptidase [Sesamum angolense]